MPANPLMRFLVYLLALGSFLTSLAEDQSLRDPPPVVEIYPTCGRSSEPRFTTVKISLINQAMLGVDPLTFDQLGKPNIGLKDQIFNAMSSITGSHDAFELKDFIGKAIQDVYCAPFPSLLMRTLYNYNAYRDTMRKMVHFNSEDDIKMLGRRLCTTANYELYSCSSDEEQKLVEFFQLGGEVVLGEAYCRTHTVSVNLITRPAFTENFHRALGEISFAAANPVAEQSRKMFQDFLKQFGTHFQDTTYFGSRLLIMKLFTKRAAHESESAERRRCVSSSFTQNLYTNFSFDDIAQHFSRDATQCAESERASDVINLLGLSSTRILTVGTVPFPDQDATLRRPVPIQYRLEKISEMFQKDWYASLGCGVNGTVMQEFFENMTSEYQNASLGASCAAARETGCGYNSNCSLGEECFDDNTTSEGFSCQKRNECSFTNNCPPQKVCVEDPTIGGYSCVEPCTVYEICASDEACYAEQHSLRGYICVSTKPGRAVIIGGSDGVYRLRTAEHVNFKSFPNLPVSFEYSAAATAGEHLVLCGGWQNGKISNKCYRINTTSPDSEWEAIPPAADIKMVGHSGVTIAGTKVWFMSNTHLVEFNGETLHFATKNLPFDARVYHCSVANGSHAYVVGAGSEREEIWVNERAMDATAWRQVGRMTRGRIGHACLWYGSNIMITGGAAENSDVEMFNTETGEVWTGKDLLTAREDHKMMLLDGMPTVLGGRENNEYLNTFESFSLESNRWEKLTRTLESLRAFFDLVEV